MRSASIPAVIAVTLGLLAQPASAAENGAGARSAEAIEPVRLGYTIYAGGLRALALDMRVALDPPRYGVQTQVRATGFLARILSFVLEARTTGMLRADGLVPAHYATANQWRERDIRKVAMRYGGAPVPAVTAIPPARKDDRGRVPEAQRQGTVDPLTGIFDLLLADGGACRGTARIFDGRRRYDISAEPDGREQLAASGYGIYSGPAQVCRLSVETIGGFWNTMDERKRYPDAVRIWLAEAVPGAPPVPVRLQMDTSYAAIVGHLTATHRGDAAELPESRLDGAAELPSAGGAKAGQRAR